MKTSLSIEQIFNTNHKHILQKRNRKYVQRTKKENWMIKSEG